MKITLNREQLAKSSTLALSAIENRPVIPIWDSLYFKSIAGDLYIYGRGEANQIRVYQRIDHLDDFEFIAPAKMFVETIRGIKSDTIEITIEQGKQGDVIIINAVGRKSKFKITTEKPKNYSVDIVSELSQSFKTTSRDILPYLKNALQFPNEKDIRVNFQGVSIRNFEEKIEITGTNGFSIARYLLDINSKISPIVITKSIISALTVFPQEGDISIGTTDRSVVIDNGNIQVISRTLDTKFPDVNQFWVTEFLENQYISISKNEIIEVLRLFKNFSTDENFSVKISVSGNSVTFTSYSYEKTNFAEHTIECENFDVKDMDVGVNIHFLEKVVNIINTDNFNLHIKAHNKPIFITEVNNSLTNSYIIQPVLL